MAKSSLKVGKVYHHLQQQILSGALNPGDQLPRETDLVRQFGISRPTITKAVNELITEGYVYKKAGMGNFVKERTISSKEGPVIGLLIPLSVEGGFFRPLADQISRLSVSMNFTLILGGVYGDAETGSTMEQTADFYIKRKVDGVLMVPCVLADSRTVNHRLAENFERAGIPVVLVDADYMSWPERSSHDLVGIDNVRSAYKVCRHFTDQGASRVDFVFHRQSSEIIPQRILGYQQALFHAGIIPDPSWVHGISDYSNDVLEALISSGAVNFMCANDDTALRLGSQLLRRGFSIPRQVRITGFDNLEAARYFPVSLTTVSQPRRDMARTIIRTLMERIREPGFPVRNVMLDAELVVRESGIVPQNG